MERLGIDTSVNIINSFPDSAEPNLTFLTPQPGARQDPLVQSNGSSDNQPPAAPFPICLSADIRVLSVWKTFNGFVLRTSHTTTEPSCDATANLVPLSENAVENEAARLVVKYSDDGSAGGMARVVIGVNERREPPDIRWRNTCVESPTDNNVRPSGDRDAISAH